MAEVPISRPSPPRAEDYVVVPGSQGPRRDFRISVGLREGWDAEGRVFDVSEAVRTARAWMKRRVESGQPALSGMFTRAEVTYAWPRDDGTVGSDREPVALFTGEAVHAYLGHLSDAAIEAMLNELPAYAATIHKSQGSEYPAVIIPVLTQHYAMLQRNLLYTGVTRGKRLVVLIGQKKAIAIAVRNVSGRRRWSKLDEWLRLSTPSRSSTPLKVD